MVSRLQEVYTSEIRSSLQEQFGYSNPMQIPRLQKVVLNMGVGEALGDKKVLEHAVSNLELISGQKVVVTRARKSIAGFKVREDWPIGCKVTLRRERMYEFLERLIAIAIPRIRDFRGLNAKSFDGRGNYNLGLKEQLIFNEIDYDKVEKVKGLNITIVTSAKNDEEGRALLRNLGMPFRK